ncbi:hypothetical protein HDU86_003523 [Geranomyces michiganensis]|nr:hypothetical protein HDU86_003523 [Geranomyces michiganensis]
MPGLVLYKRRWDIASDDLFLPAAWGLGVHTAWLLGSLIVYRRTRSNPDNTCTNEAGLETYLIFTVVALFFEIAVELAIAWISLQGTVADDRPRRHMNKAVYAHSTLIILEVIAQILGFRLIWGSNPLACPSSTHTVLIVHLLVYISTAGLLLYGLIVLLLFLRSTPLNVDSIDHAAVWHSRLSWMFFSHRRKQNLGGDSGDGDVLADVARVFADFLRDAQTVPSDILVGIVLLRRKQKRDMVMGLHGEVNEDPNDPPCVNVAAGDERAVEHQPPHPRSRRGSTSSGWETAPVSPMRGTSDVKPTESLSSARQRIVSLPNLQIPTRPSSPPGSPQGLQQSRSQVLPVRRTELEAISDFYPYAMSIYGLPLYVFSNFGRGLFHLLCPCARTPPESAVAAVQTNTAPSFVACLPCFSSSQPKDIADQMLPHADIVHVSLRGGLFRSPFVVCFDHPRRTVVIAVRGTLSTADVLVDLNCDLTEIQLPGGLVAHTHSGMFRTARNLLSELTTTGALRRVLLDPASQYGNYSILTTGHSLGGGVAALLAFLLTDLFPAHSTTCIAYSPPGCMITAPAIPYFRRFCISVVMGLDVVPRLNRNTLETLKRAVDDEVRTCNVHKLKVLGGTFTGGTFTGGTGRADGGRGGGEVSGGRRGSAAVVPGGATSSSSSSASSSALARGAADPRWTVDLESQAGTRTEAAVIDDAIPRVPGLNHPKTYLPGRILYFRRAPHDASGSPSTTANVAVGGPSSSPTISAPLLTPGTGSGSWRRPRKRMYTPVWAAPAMFQEIVISANMARDHMPYHLKTLLDRVKEDGMGMEGDAVAGSVMC